MEKPTAFLRKREMYNIHSADIQQQSNHNMYMYLSITPLSTHNKIVVKYNNNKLFFCLFFFILIIIFFYTRYYYYFKLLI